MRQIGQWIKSNLLGGTLPNTWHVIRGGWWVVIGMCLEIKEIEMHPAPNVPETRYLGVKEAAKYLGLAESTLYTMVSQQRIPFAKMGRRTKFDLEKLNKWVLTHTVEERQTICP